MIDKGRNMPFCFNFSFVFHVPFMQKYLIKLIFPVLQDFFYSGAEIINLYGVFLVEAFSPSLAAILI